jgi:hypothetical protein
MYESSLIINYAENTKNICLCLSITIFLIMLFIMTPLNSFFLSSFFGKFIILILLGYILFKNIYYTNKFSDDYNISLINGTWNEGKTNIICSYIFTLFISILFISILRHFF